MICDTYYSVIYYVYREKIGMENKFDYEDQHLARFYSDEFYRKAQRNDQDWTELSIDRGLYIENVCFTFIKSVGLFITAFLLSGIFGAEEGIVYSVLILPLIAILKTAYLDFEPLFIHASYSDKAIIVRRGTAAESIERLDLRTVENIELKLTPVGKIRNSGTLDIYGYGGQVRIPYIKDPIAVQTKLEKLIQNYKSDYQNEAKG